MMLRTTDVIVVGIELVLETDDQVTLCSRKLVRSAWPSIVDPWDAIDGLSLQEGICIGHCLKDTGARK